MTYPTSGLDEVVHQRARLGVLALLDQSGEVSFGVLREQLDLTEGNLSRHVRILEEAGYLEVTKGYEGRRPRTWLRITKSGKAALALEMGLLRQIMAPKRRPVVGTEPLKAKPTTGSGSRKEKTTTPAPALSPRAT